MATADTRDIRDQPVPPRAEEARAPFFGEETIWTRTMAGGSTGEGIAGIATAVVAIIGLSHVASFYLAAVATIVLGAGLLLRGLRMATRYWELGETSRTGFAPRGTEGGVSAEFVGGAAGVVLGILALLEIYPAILLPIMAIVFGAIWLLGVGASIRLNALEREQQWIGQEREAGRRFGAEVFPGAYGGRLLVGIAALVLGIVGTVGVYPLALDLVALLVLGCSAAIGVAVSRGRLLLPLRR
jgi:hypothetical protein